MTVTRRPASLQELNEVVSYWKDCPRCTGYHQEGSLIQFLEVFTPHQIKGAMYLATASGRPNYFKYLCGILHNWRRDLEAGIQPQYFDIGK